MEVKVNKLPKGCDQQGRHPEAAEAATELGIEEPDIDPVRVVIKDTLIASVILMLVVYVVLALLGMRG
jgi:hypothetical protein